MRRAALALTIILALPLTAGADVDCITAPVDFTSDTAHLGDAIGTLDGSLRIALVGPFLWMQWDNGDVVSEELTADTTGITVCADGTLTITKPDPQPAADVDVAGHWYSIDPTLDLRVGPK